jgi:uncharacterized protein YdaU (DUF1376 family)
MCTVGTRLDRAGKCALWTLVGDSVHYYKRNLGDYAKKAGRLSMLQHGSYTLLIDACYDREQFPTRDEAIDWTWASSAAEIEAVEFVLAKFFTLEDGVYVQTRIRDELNEYHAKAATNKRIADERETKRKEKHTNRARVVNEPPPNQEPLTINQEPVLKPKPAPATRLPADWEPSPDDIAFCKATRPELNPSHVADEFRDYWIAAPGAKGRKVDWPATWRNWVRNQRAKANAPPAGKQANRDSYAAQARAAAEKLEGRTNEPIDITERCTRVA